MNLDHTSPRGGAVSSDRTPSLPTLTALAILIATTAVVPVAVAAPSATIHREAQDFFVPALESTGLSGERLDLTLFELVKLSYELEQRLDDGPSYRQARRLHHLLHRDHLLTYDAAADGLEQIVERGRFNCLSASMLYTFVAGRLGYEPVVLETPGHLMVRLHLDDRVIDIETTSPDGFDVVGHYTRLADRDAGFRAARERFGGGGAGAYGGPGNDFLIADRSQAVVFSWLNAGWRLLETGRADEVAAAVRRAADFHPELVREADGVRQLLALAFAGGYERGAFEQAYRVARAEVTTLPLTTTARDRLLAAGLKRVLEACENERPGSGLTIVEEVRSLVEPNEALRRFERDALRELTRSFVRAGSYERALQAATDYAAVEPDLIEREALRLWVEGRARSPLR